MDRRKELKKFLNKSLDDWGKDKMEKDGWPRSACTERAFCREFGYPPTTFSGHLTGNNLPEKLPIILAYAENPWIGPKIYWVIGLIPVDSLEPELREMIELWPRATPEKRKEYLAILRKTVLQTDDEKLIAP